MAGRPSALYSFCVDYPIYVRPVPVEFREQLSITSN